MERTSVIHLSFIEHLLCAGCSSRPCGSSVKKPVEVPAPKELTFWWEEVDNNQMSKLISNFSKENKTGSRYRLVLGWGW